MRVVWTFIADLDDLPGDDLIGDCRDATLDKMEMVVADYLYDVREWSLDSDVRVML